jgi:hypothetical protein
MSLEHVSGEYFVAENFDIDNHYKDRIRAQFRLGADGKPRSLGLELVREMLDEKIWFQRRPTALEREGVVEDDAQVRRVV